MKMISKVLIVLVVALVVLVGARSVLAKNIFQNVCHKATGLTLHIGQFNLGLTRPVLEIKNLKLFNPPAFSEKVMFTLSEIYVNYELGSILRRNPHLREVRIHLAQLSVEINKDGVLNLKSLVPADAPKKSPADSKGADQKAAKPMRVQIDTLKIRIDKVIFKDFSKGIPLTQEFDMNLEETYQNVQDVRAIAPLLVGKVLTNTAIGSLANFRAGDLLKNFQAAGINLKDLNLDQIAGLGPGAQELLSGFSSQAGMEKISGQAKKALEDVKSLFGSFGKE